MILIVSDCSGLGTIYLPFLQYCTLQLIPVFDCISNVLKNNFARESSVASLIRSVGYNRRSGLAGSQGKRMSKFWINVARLEGSYAHH
jgi:hypothetical protein